MRRSTDDIQSHLDSGDADGHRVADMLTLQQRSRLKPPKMTNATQSAKRRVTRDRFIIFVDKLSR